MSDAHEPPYPRPDDPEFEKKFKTYAMYQIKKQQEPSPKTGPFGFPPLGVQHPPAKADQTDKNSSGESETSKATAMTDDKKPGRDRLEERLCKKIDDSFAFLEERLDKEFQLLHHIMIASWEGAE
ncbi:hypothetical protein FVEN_g2192 [Fusarium venenatum]|uniref:Uncharacterized protein n=1 Tax=Fusarium venenatum TaxID=56646 RepID=A0A2L2SPS6_9HYPO|nr:uncharacterized protein FVRRES_12615 [Fusarium venenatum]KAG8360285.1 hypothetical protein FVEN_g2192 [Fusarium venenatum]CEI39924.1 unnamed protein product [Fusarium venenatum]